MSVIGCLRGLALTRMTSSCYHRDRTSTGRHAVLDDL